MRSTSDVEKIKNRRKQIFEDEVNNIQLDKRTLDHIGSNLNSKYFKSATPVLKYPDSFIQFFSLCSISLHLKYNLILRHKARVKALGRSSFLNCALCSCSQEHITYFYTASCWFYQFITKRNFLCT